MADLSRRRALALLFVCLVLAGPLASSLAGGAAVVDGSTATASADPSSAENGTEGIEIDDDLATADGTVEVVVRLEGVPDRALGRAEDEGGLLSSHADASQDRVLEYADDAAGVAVVNRFWVTNAVVFEVNLESFGRFENVTEIHANVGVAAPDPPSDPAGRPNRSGAGEATAGSYVTTPGLARTNVPAVWDEYDARGEGVRVAVLDTGIDVGHPDLDLYTDDPADPTYPGGWAEFDVAGDRVAGSRPHDDGVHGTHVSGTVAGGDAGGRHIGVAPDAELMHGLVLSESTGGTFAQLVAGIEWALENDADVISMSLGAAGRHDAFVDPVRNARAQGAVVVAAVGNEGAGASNSPANVHDAVGVGAVDDGDRVADFSGGGALEADNWTAPPEDWPAAYVVPDVVAPGWFATSSVPGGGYEAYPGTSMATPHVVGTVALLLSVDPSLTPADVEAALYDTAWKPDGESTAPDPRYGHGIADAKAAADAVAPP